MKKPWTLRKRVFLSSVAIMGIVTFLLSVFNVMEIYLTERNTTAFETYMNLSTFFDSLSEAGGCLEEYLYTENEDSLIMMKRSKPRSRASKIWIQLS